MSTRQQTKRDARPRGVPVQLVDLASLEAKWTEEARQLMPDRVDEDRQLELGWKPWGLMTCADGSRILVCVEGVGYNIADDEPATLELYVRMTDEAKGQARKYGGKETVGMFPVATVQVALSDVAALATGETVDLADHIRVFGERLESNHRSLYRKATA